MKLTLEIELTKMTGTAKPIQLIREVLIEEIEGMGSLWVDETPYELEVKP